MSPTRREHITTACLAALLGTQKFSGENAVKSAVDYADLLIAELDKPADIDQMLAKLQHDGDYHVRQVSTGSWVCEDRLHRKVTPRHNTPTQAIVGAYESLIGAQS